MTRWGIKVRVEMAPLILAARQWSFWAPIFHAHPQGSSMALPAIAAVPNVRVAWRFLLTPLGVISTDPQIMCCNQHAGHAVVDHGHWCSINDIPLVARGE